MFEVDWVGLHDAAERSFSIGLLRHSASVNCSHVGMWIQCFFVFVFFNFLEI